MAFEEKKQKSPIPYPYPPFFDMQIKTRLNLNNDHWSYRKILKLGKFRIFSSLSSLMELYFAFMQFHMRQTCFR